MAEPSEPRLQFVTGTIPICSACLDGEGGECHTPGCILWINRAPDLAIRSMLSEHGCRVDVEHPHGLHLVTDADKRVLDEMANAGLTRNRDGARFKTRAKEKAVCEAELARRGEKA